MKGHSTQNYSPMKGECRLDTMNSSKRRMKGQLRQHSSFFANRAIGGNVDWILSTVVKGEWRDNWDNINYRRTRGRGENSLWFEAACSAESPGWWTAETASPRAFGTQNLKRDKKIGRPPELSARKFWSKTTKLFAFKSSWHINFEVRQKKWGAIKSSRHIKFWRETK